MIFRQSFYHRQRICLWIALWAIQFCPNTGVFADEPQSSASELVGDNSSAPGVLVATIDRQVATRQLEGDQIQRTEVAPLSEQEAALTGHDYRIVLRHQGTPGNFWDQQVTTNSKVAVEAGQPALLRFWGRTVTAGQQPEDEGEVAVYFQRAGEPWDKSVLAKHRLPRRWKLFQIPFRFHQNFSVSEAQLCVGFGSQPQHIEVTGVEVRAFQSTVELEQLPGN